MATPHEDDADFKPTFSEGYKLGEKKTVDEYAQLDPEDEALNRWKASLGIKPGQPSASASGPKVQILSLELRSPTLPAAIIFDLRDEGRVAALKNKPVTIKEGVEYSVGATFQVAHSIVTGLRYIQVVKKAHMKVDKLEAMLGSYGPSSDGKPYERPDFHTEDSPSGLLARQGTYNVRSKFVDDDGEIYADLQWQFKIAKEW